MHTRSKHMPGPEPAMKREPSSEETIRKQNGKRHRLDPRSRQKKKSGQQGAGPSQEGEVDLAQGVFYFDSAAFEMIRNFFFRHTPIVLQDENVSLAFGQMFQQIQDGCRDESPDFWFRDFVLCFHFLYLPTTQALDPCIAQFTYIDGIF